jgi:hypothetical protein
VPRESELHERSNADYVDWNFRHPALPAWHAHLGTRLDTLRPSPPRNLHVRSSTKSRRRAVERGRHTGGSDTVKATTFGRRLRVAAL